jgi:hypothetical protein
VNGNLAQTSIYRMFPASKSNTIEPDDAINTLNHNLEALWQEYSDQGQLHPDDRRGFYRLVGAQWMDKPAFFTLDSQLQNNDASPLLKPGAVLEDVGQAEDRALFFAEHPGATVTGIDDIRLNGSDSAFSILAGEDRMSSTAMESFTQAPDSFRNCFACHNTQAVTDKGVPLNQDRSGVRLLEPKLLNVSHVLSQFVLEECDVAANRRTITNPDGTTTAVIVCPPDPPAPAAP